jgi:hypothetical protein
MHCIRGIFVSLRGQALSGEIQKDTEDNGTETIEDRDRHRTAEREERKTEKGKQKDENHASEDEPSGQSPGI